MATDTGKVIARIGADVPGMLFRSLSGAFRFTRRWPVIPGLILVVLLVSAIFAPWLKPHDPLTNQGVYLAPPAWTAEGSPMKKVLES